MEKETGTYWFKRRRYGYGWSPSTWQGWSVLSAYLVSLIVLSFVLLDSKSDEFTPENDIFFASLSVLTALLLIIAIKKGPRAAWRWGKRDTDIPEEDF